MKKFKNTNCHPERSEGSKRKDSSLTLRMTKGRIYLTILLALLCAAVAGLGIALLDFKPATRGTDGVLDGNKTVSAAAGTVTSVQSPYEKEFFLDATGGTTFADKWNDAINYSVTKNAVVRVTLNADWVATAISSYPYTTFGGVAGTGSYFTPNNLSGSSGDLYGGSLLVPTNAKVILNLNGYKLDRSNSNAAATTHNTFGGVICVDGGQLEIRDDSMQTQTLTGGVGSDTIVVDKGTICGGRAAYAGAIMVMGTATGSKLTITSGTIAGNTSLNLGGAVWCLGDNADFVMNGGYVVNNVCTAGTGGGLYLQGKSTINGGVIAYNSVYPTLSAGSYGLMGGGGIGVYSLGGTGAGTLTINGGDIHHNFSTTCGGGILVARPFSGGGFKATCILNGGFVRDNECFLQDSSNNIIMSKVVNGGTYIFGCGGAVAVSQQCEFIMNGGELTDNVGVYGSAVYNVNSDFTLNDGLIAKNFNIDCCAAVWAESQGVNAGDYCTYTFNGGRIIDNKGGGILARNFTKVNMGGGIIVSNNYSRLQTSFGNSLDDFNLFLYKKNPGTQAIATEDAIINITGPLITNGQAARVGITIGTSSAALITNNANITSNYSTVYGSEMTASGGAHSETFFFADHPSINVVGGDGSNCILCYDTTKYGRNSFAWEYDITDETGATSTGVTPVDQYIEIPYGSKITAVRASFEGKTASWTAGTITDMLVQNSAGSSSFTQIQDAGSYTFAIDRRSVKYSWVPSQVSHILNDYLFDNGSLTVRVMPKAVTVKIKNTSGYYSQVDDLQYDASAAATLSGDSLGITLKRDEYSFSTGVYKVFGSWSNKNYAVSFINETDANVSYGKYTIKQLPVYVIINNNEEEFGSTTDMPSKVVTTKNDSKTTLFEEDGTTVKEQKFIGGWRYGKDTAGNASNTFHPQDLTATVMPFKLVSTQLKAAQTAAGTGGYVPVSYDTTAGATDPTTQTGKPVAGYQIIADPASINGNYDIKFYYHDDTSANDYAVDATKAYGIFTVKEAEIKVGKNTTTNDYLDTIAFKDLPSGGKKVEISGTVTLKGGVAANQVTYTYLDEPDLTNPANSGWTAPTHDTFYNTAYTWTPKASMTAKTGAGTYVVYYKLSAPNHAIKIQKWTLKVTADALNYSFKIEAVKTVNGTTTRSTITATPPESDYEKNTVIEVTAVKTDGSAIPATTGDAKYTVYYMSTDAGTFGKWDESTDGDGSGTNKISSADSKKHRDYGTTEKPKNAGSYKATLVKNTNNNYELTNTAGSDVATFTINKGKVTAPKDTNTAALTYNGAVQSFKLGNSFDDALLKLDGYEDPSGAAIATDGDFAKSKSWQLKATNAGDYTAKFSLKDKTNYEWASSVDTAKVDANGVYSLTLTVNRAAVKIKWEAPDPSATDPWVWKPSDYPSSSGGTDKYIKYALDPSSIMTVGGVKEAVTVELYWTLVPAGGFSDSDLADNATTCFVNDITTNLDILDISTFTKGKYYVYAVLEDESTNPVNANYVIETEYGLPKTNDARQAFEVTDGSANLSGMPWKYKYLNETGGSGYVPAKNYVTGSTDPDDDTKLVYTPLSATTAREYVIELDTADDAFPSYLEIDTDAAAHPVAAVAAKISSMGLTFVSGTGYTTNKYTTAGSYTTYVLLKIKGADTKFENKAGTPYTYVDDTHAIAKIEWKIEKFTVDLSDVTVGYKVEDLIKGTLSAFKQFNKVNDETDPSKDPIWVYEVDVQGGNLIKPAVDLPTNLSAAPFDLSAILDPKTPTGNGAGANRVSTVTPAGTTLSTTFGFNIKSAASANYQLAPSPDNQITIKWRVTVATLDFDGSWDTSGETTLTGEVTKPDGTKIVVTLKTPVIESDDPDIADKVEYVYTWDAGDGNGPQQYKGLQGLYELNEKANAMNGGAGGMLADIPGASAVTVTVQPKTGYKFDGSLPASDFVQNVDVGDTRTRVSVTLKSGSLNGEYKNIGFEFEVKDLSANADLNSGLYKLYIYKTDNASGIATAEKAELSADELNKLSAGKYYVGIKLLNETYYMVLPGQEYFELNVNPIELDLPTLVNNPTFTGSLVEVEDLLDDNTKANLALLTISGQGSVGNGFRDTGTTLTLVIELKDPVNYKWKTSGSATPAKYVLTAGEAQPETSIDPNNAAQANIEWEVLPLKIAVTDSMWKLNAKGGPKLNYTMPAGVEAEFEYVPYETKNGGTPLESFPVGTPVWTSAVLTGADAENGNVVFADSGANETLSRVSHTEPKAKDFKQVAGKAVDFVKTNWLWFAIGAGVLLFLLLLIILIAHRRKTKEKREEKKAAKEAAKAEAQAKADAEKERREAEKARLESQREIEKMKAEAEAAKAKAQAEAEIAKIKAQAQAQQPVIPRELATLTPNGVNDSRGIPPTPAPQYMQQPPAQPPFPQQATHPQMQQMPMPQAQSADSGAISRMEAQLAAMQAQQAAKDAAEQKAEIAALRAESRAKDAAEQKAEIAALRAELQSLRYGANLPAAPQTGNASATGGTSMDLLGALVVAALKNLAGAPAAYGAAETPAQQTVREEVSQPVSAAYPPDAVITTTTTVDRTKKSEARSRDIEREASEGFTDIDGFYEKYE